MFWRNRSRIAAAFGLLIVTLPPSMNWPPPDGGDPLERVAGQPLVAVPLEDQAGELRVRGLLAVLDLLRHREERAQVVGGLP